MTANVRHRKGDTTQAASSSAAERDRTRGISGIDPSSPGGRLYAAIISNGYRSASAFLKDLKDQKGLDIKDSNFSMFLRGQKGMGDDRLNIITDFLGITLDYLQKGVEPSIEDSFLYRQTSQIVEVMESITEDSIRDSVLNSANRIKNEWLSSVDRIRRMEEVLQRLSRKLSREDIDDLKSAVGIRS